MAITWEDPGPYNTGPVRNRWTEEAEELRNKPHEWGCVCEKENTSKAANMVTAIKVGRYAAFRPVGAWTTARRGTKVYVKYVGD